MADTTINGLPEFTGNLAATSFVPIMDNGATYKYSPLTKSVGLTGDQIIAGVKTFSSSPIVPAGDASGEAVNYGQVVKNSGNEDIAGVKNFTSTPTVSGTPVIMGTTSSTPSAGKVMVWQDLDGYIPARNNNITGENLFAIGKVGKFMGQAVTNAPDAGWWYFDIDIHEKGVYEHYTAYAVTRVGVYSGWLLNGVWSEWVAL